MIYLQTIITFFRTFKSSKYVQLTLVKKLYTIFYLQIFTKSEKTIYKTLNKTLSSGVVLIPSAKTFRLG